MKCRPSWKLQAICSLLMFDMALLADRPCVLKRAGLAGNGELAGDGWPRWIYRTRTQDATARANPLTGLHSGGRLDAAPSGGVGAGELVGAGEGGEGTLAGGEAGGEVAMGGLGKGGGPVAGGGGDEGGAAGGGDAVAPANGAGTPLGRHIEQGRWAAASLPQQVRRKSRAHCTACCMIVLS